MARLTAAHRRNLPASDFAGPDESYPVDTPARARSAAGFAAMHHAPAAVKERIHEIAARKGFTHHAGSVTHHSSGHALHHGMKQHEV